MSKNDPKRFSMTSSMVTNLLGRIIDIQWINIAFISDRWPEQAGLEQGLAITFVSDENDARIHCDGQHHFELNRHGRGLINSRM
ncbi:spliceosome RNA helicase DDX39B-like [Macaca nemestrina]|uniref:spliceosome RNA helicase DDX39B-like n=1 Tax=Macaca nemestrina TaxID=9545 RepID=UPI0039B85D04